MKHVFGIASNLAFYIANKIVELDHIAPEDCVFLLLRGFRIPDCLSSRYPNQIVTRYNTNHGEGRVFQGWRFWNTQSAICEFDNLVDSYLQGEPFVWYAQNCNNDVCSLMVSKANCVAYHVLEDGTGSYRPYNPATFTGLNKWIYKCMLRPIWPRLFCVKGHFIETNHPNFRSCIATSQRCFPLHQSVLRVIGNPFVPEPISPAPDAVLSVDALYVQFTDSQTEDIFRRLGEHISRRGYRHVLYKYHPYLTTETNRARYDQYETWIHQYFTVPMTQLPPTACLENILTAHPCDFYTVFSSVAIYAHGAGCTCYSLLPSLRAYTDVKVPLIEEICIPIE